jgi:hypothetical protein
MAFGSTGKRFRSTRTKVFFIIQLEIFNRQRERLLAFQVRP